MVVVIKIMNAKQLWKMKADKKATPEGEKKKMRYIHICFHNLMTKNKIAVIAPSHRHRHHRRHRPPHHQRPRRPLSVVALLPGWH